MLGIAVVTYNRLAHLERVVEAIESTTSSRHRLVVADDGSEDGSAEWCAGRGLTVITGANRGVCWNKNRGLYALMQLDCDPILLMEDDIYPVETGWERDWIEATRLWHHLAFAHPKIRPQAVSGTGTPADPYVNNKATAQCTGVSQEALKQVGYLDTRFKGYGVGHAEWTTRFKRARYGYKEIRLEDGRRAKANLYIDSGLRAEDAQSFRDNAQVKANRELFRQIKREPIYRNPWHTEAERASFMGEQLAAGLKPRARGTGRLRLRTRRLFARKRAA